MQFGVDITNSRLDDLDKRVLAYVEGRTKLGLVTRVLDVGCGAGGLAMALAKVGAMVTALDIDDYAEVITAKAEALSHTVDNVTFVQSDIASFLTQPGTTFDCVVLQRVLHYLPYDEAKKVLIKLAEQTTMMYLAVTGTTTAIAQHYPVLKLSIDQRFEILDNIGQELFSITAPICLYNEAEIKQLLSETGWYVTWSRVSDFGNIKVVARTNQI